MAELDFSSRGTPLEGGGALDFSDESVEASARRPSVMDVAKQALIGFGPDAAQGFGWLLEKAGLDYGREMRIAGKDTERDILESMTPGGRRAATTPMFEGDSLEDLGVTDKWGQSLIMGASRSLPQMAQMVIPGAAIAKGVSVIPGVAGLAKAPGVAGAAARYLPGALGFGAAEGLQAGALNAAQTQGEIEGSDPATLPAHSRRYRELLGEMDPAAAQRTLADEAASQVFRRTAPWTGAVGALTGGGALGGLVRPGRQSVLRAISGGAGSEALQEAPQSGGERYIQNVAEREFVDERVDPWKQVVAEALTGGAIGGVTGGAVGGAGRVMRGRTVEGEVTGREITREIGAARDALGDVAQAQETERAVDTARRTAESLKAKAAALAIPPAKGAADEVEIQDATAADAAGAQARARGENALGDAAAGNATAGDAAAGGQEAPGVLAGPAVGDGSRQAPVEVRSAEDVERAAATARTDYTPPQGEANNVRRGHLRWNDLEGTIEVPAGGTRKGTNPKTGETWETKHTAPYGYWKGTKDADDMHVDVIWGPELDRGHPVYVLDEIDEKGEFRQHKTLPGFPSEQAAREAYLGISSKKPEHVGAVTAMPVEQFKTWLKGDTTKPVAYRKGAQHETDFKGAFKGTGKAISDNLYAQVFSALKAGHEKISGVRDPVLVRAEPAYKAGHIKTAADIRRFEETGYPPATVAPAQPKGEQLGDATQQLPAAGEQAAEQEPAAGEQRTEEPAAPAVQAPAGVERPQQVEKPKRLLPAERRARAAEEAAKRQAERTVVVPERDREILRTMAAESGWVEKGGKAIGARTAFEEGLGFKTRREMNEAGAGTTQWIGRPEWARGFDMTADEMKTAVEKAIAGKPMGPKQRAAVQAMLGELRDGERLTAEVEAQAEAASDIAVDRLADKWPTMAEDEKDAALDALFGGRPEAPAAQGEGAREATSEAEARREVPAERQPGEDDEVDGRAEDSRRAAAQPAEDAGADGVRGDRAGESSEAQAASAAGAQTSQAAEVARFEVGRSLTAEQRKKVLATLVDVYKAKGAEKVSKGLDRDGNDIIGYAHSPELFEKSDITGAMVRYYVTLPDGKIAHPTELFPNYTQSDIDAELLAQRERARQKKDEVQRFEKYATDTAEQQRAYWQKLSDESLARHGQWRTIVEPAERALFEKGGKFTSIPTAYRDVGLAMEEAGWKRAKWPAERPSLELQSQTEQDLKAKEEAAAAAEKKKAEEEAVVEAKRKADAERGSFALTGSERQADANPNQGGLFGNAITALRTAADELERAAKPGNLPERTADTMSDAIALSSPNGRMSRRARKSANERLSKALFGEGGLQRESTPQPSERERLLAQATRLRDLAARGMNARAYLREAERLEAEAKKFGGDETPMFSRQADAISEYALERGTDKRGQPAFANQHIVIANAVPDPGEGVQSYTWTIYDRTNPGEKGSRFRKVGTLYADLGPDGKFEKLRLIETYRRYRQKGLGYGESVLASMLASNGRGYRMGIQNIVHHVEPKDADALPFWRKMGVRLLNYATDPSVEINGDVSLEDYLRARGERSSFNRDANRGRTESLADGTQGALAPEGQARARRDTRGDEPGADGRGDRGRQGVLGREPGSARGARAEVARRTASIREAVEPIIKAWGNAPEVVLINSMADAPAAVRVQDEGQRSQGATGTPEAFIYRNKVYLVAEGIASPASAVRALLHESVGHFGLRGVFGERLNGILDDVAKSMPDRVKAKAKEYGLDFGDVGQRRQAAEEVLAEMAQSTPRAGIVRRAIAAIREFLRSLGIDLGLSNNDIIANFIIPARQFVERSQTSGAEAVPTAAFGRASATDSDAFKKWFGSSKVVDENGKPLVVYHGTRDVFTTFQSSRSEGGMYFTDSPDDASLFAGTPEQIGAGGSLGDNPQVIPAYLSMQNPLDMNVSELFNPETTRKAILQAKARGHDGVILRWIQNFPELENETTTYIVFRPEQIKGAIGNRGSFDPANADIRFQRAGAATPEGARGALERTAMPSARELFEDLTHSDRKLNRVISKFNTPFHIAETHPEFKPVYREAQDYSLDVSRIVNEAADLAKDLLPRIEGMADFKKKTPSSRDVEVIADALYAGTLWGNGSPLEGRVWTDEELNQGKAIDNGVWLPSFKPLTEAQIGLYRQALGSVAHSVTEHSKALIWRLAKMRKIMLDRGMSIEDMAESARRDADAELTEVKADFNIREDERTARMNAAEGATVGEISKEGRQDADRVQKQIDELEAFKASVSDIETKTKGLVEHGYFPAMRFGKYAVNVDRARPNGTREELYFGRFETQVSANMAKRELQREFPDARITSGVMNDDAHKLFQGLNLDALELFAEHLVDENGQKVSADPIMQQYFRVATTERSALKRQIHRKGTPGFSKDVPRALAQFTVSQATSASRSYHAAGMLEKVRGIKAGDLQAYATRYVRYLQDPQEEAAALRGFLANYYILGSIAFGAINMTQPVLMSAPYLTQYTGWAKSMAALGKAAVDLVGGRKNLTADEADAYARAAKAGIVSPQEIHQIRAETRASMLGDSPLWQKLEGIAEAKGLRLPGKLLLRKAAFLWGSIYALTEQFNRGTTFIAAYRIARETGQGDAYEFARKAVDATQGVYLRTNRPEISRGPAGATIMTFKQFSIAYLELAKRLYDRDKKAFAVLMLTLVALAGAEGLPFAEDIEDLVDTIGQWLGYGTNSRKRIRRLATDLLGPDIADIMLHGFSAIPGVPLDVANRLGMHNLIPGSAILKASEPDKTRDITDLLGPAATIFKNAGNALEGLATGRPGETKLLLPKALQDIGKAMEMVETGAYKDTKGRRVMDVDALDAAVKFVGFQPAKVARETRIIGQNYQDIALHKVMEDAIAGKWARGIADGDQYEIEEARAQWRAWNEANPELRIAINNQQLRRRVKELRAAREGRLIKSAPREIRGDVARDLRR